MFFFFFFYALGTRTTTVERCFEQETRQDPTTVLWTCSTEHTVSSYLTLALIVIIQYLMVLP